MKQIAALFLTLLLALPAHAEELNRKGEVAFLGLTFIDTSTEGAYNGVRDDEVKRLALVEEAVRGEIAPKASPSPIFLPLRKNWRAPSIRRTAMAVNCAWQRNSMLPMCLPGLCKRFRI